MIGYVTLGTADLAKSSEFYDALLRSVDLLRTNFGQQYIGNHIILNASDTILA
jgi:catechol 2,3-dioxygenase-like lactoylglutathione lyase family enzyme